MILRPISWSPAIIWKANITIPMSNRGYLVFLHSESISEYLLSTYNSGAAAVYWTLQLKEKNKFPYHYPLRIWKITLDVSHSPGELLSYHIFVLSLAQELKKRLFTELKTRGFKKWYHNSFIVSTYILLPNSSHHS